MIEEAMSSRERVEKAIRLEVPDRVPVAPHYRALPGLSTADLIFDLDKAEKVHRDTFDKHGGWDIVTPAIYIGSVPAYPYPNPLNAIYFNVRIPGIDASPWSQSLVELVEEPPLMDEDGYDRLINEGFIRFLNFRKVGLSSLLRSMNPEIQKKTKLILEYWYERKVAMTLTAAWQPFELVAHMRNLKNFLIDLHRRPEKIKEVCDATIDGLIELTKVSAYPVKKYSNMMHICAHRVSSEYFAPTIFEELYFPYLKKMIEEFAKAGFISQIHADANWTAFLEYLRELPKGSMAWVEFDGTTDIFKAKEVIGDRICIKGDVPASLLVFGTPNEVEKYCKKLIDVVGQGGGFILSSGCDTPPHAKFENVKKMIDTAKTYGVYK